LTVPQGGLGADLLAQFDVELDFPNKRLSLYQAKGCNPSSPEFRPWEQPCDSYATRQLFVGTVQ